MSSVKKLKIKAERLLSARKYGELRTLLKKFPTDMRQAAFEYELQMLLSEERFEDLSHAFDSYLDQFKVITTENLEVAAKLKLDREQYEQSLKIADRILEQDPLNHTAVNVLYVVYVNTKQKEKAYRIACQILSKWLESDQSLEVIVDARLKIVLTATQISRFKEAIYQWEEVEPHKSTFAHLFASEHYACAIRAYANLGQIDDGTKIVESLPSSIMSSDNVTAALPLLWFHAGDKKRCYDAYEVMKQHPSVDPVETIWNRGLARLGFGDISDGLEDYEIRWKWDEFPSAKRVFSSPLWTGQDLKGKAILIWGEQGIGDQLLFLTLLPVVLSKHPSEVAVEVSEKLVPLVQRWYPEVKVSADGVLDTSLLESYRQFDFNIPVGSLMQRHWSDNGSFNSGRNIRLLKPPTAARDLLLPKSFKQKKRLIGISWRSHLVTDARRGNYMSVDAMIKMIECLPADVGVVSLQYAITEDERKKLTEYENVFVPDIDFFSKVDENALYAGICDLVVTSGTVTLQLAGIYGVPTLTWLPHRDWVLLGHDHYPWFENVLVVKGAPDWSVTAMLDAIIRKLSIVLRISP